MGNPLNNVLKYIDPIGNAAGNAISGPKGILTPKTGAAPPGYNPASKPGAALQQPPPGGPPGAGGPSSGLFGAPQTPRGYAPNPFQSGGGAGIGTGMTAAGPGPSGPGAQLQPGPGQINPFRGGTPPVGQPPATASGNQGMPPSGPQNPQLQQQQMIAQLLRGNPGGPPSRSMMQ